MDITKELTEIKEKATPVNTMKFLGGTLISVGAATAVTMLFKGSTNGMKGMMKLLTKLGVFVLGCKVGEIAEDYFSETIDKLIASLKEVKEEEKHEPADQ